jgi:hypothetical protein
VEYNARSLLYDAGYVCRLWSAQLSVRWPSSPKIVAASLRRCGAVADHVPLLAISTIFLFLLPSSSLVLPIEQDFSHLDSSQARLNINAKKLLLLRRGDIAHY